MSDPQGQYRITYGDDPIPYDWDLAQQVTAEGAAPPPGEKPWNKEKHQEWMRSWIAFALLLLLATVMLTLLFAFIGGNITPDQMKDVGLILLSPLTTLVGAVIGFYYGTQTK